MPVNNEAQINNPFTADDKSCPPLVVGIGQSEKFRPENVGCAQLIFNTLQEVLTDTQLLTISAVDPKIFRSITYEQPNTHNSILINNYIARTQSPYSTPEQLYAYLETNLKEKPIESFLRYLGINDSEPTVKEITKDKDKPASISFSTIYRIDISTDSRLQIHGLNENHKLLIVDLDLDPHLLDATATSKYQDSSLVINSGLEQLVRFGMPNASPEMRAQLYTLFASMTRSGEQPTAFIGSSSLNTDTNNRYANQNQLQYQAESLNQQIPVNLILSPDTQNLPQTATINLPTGTKITLDRIVCTRDNCQVVATFDPLDIPRQLDNIPTFSQQISAYEYYVPSYPYRIILDLTNIAIDPDNAKPTKNQGTRLIYPIGMTHTTIDLPQEKYYGPPQNTSRSIRYLADYHSNSARHQKNK